MFERILVPLDGSTRAERAVPVATRLARASGGVVILVRVVSLSKGFWPFFAQQASLAQQMLAADRAQAKAYLKGVAICSVLEGIPTQRVVRCGPTISSLLAVAASSQADLMVLGSHSSTGIKGHVMGSIGQKLSRAAQVPVLVLHEDGLLPGETQTDGARPARAIVLLDGTARAKAALEPAARLLAALATSRAGILHLVRMVEPVSARSEAEGMESANAEVKRSLRETAEQIRAGVLAPAVSKHHLAVAWSVVDQSYRAETLSRWAEHIEVQARTDVFGGCDVIALVKSGRDGLRGRVMGKVAERMLRDAKIPLLIVPSQPGDRDKDEQEEEREDRPVLV
jgi:nucleotide-binding universal stress UspA family protein